MLQVFIDKSLTLINADTAAGVMFSSGGFDEWPASRDRTAKCRIQQDPATTYYIPSQNGQPCAEGGAILLHNEDWGRFDAKDCMVFYYRAEHAASRAAALETMELLLAISDAVDRCTAKPPPGDLGVYSTCIVRKMRAETLGVVLAPLSVNAASTLSSGSPADPVAPDGGLFVDRRTVRILGDPSVGVIEMHVIIVVSPYIPLEIG